MKPKKKCPTSYVLEVRKYSVRIYPANSAAVNKSMGYIILVGEGTPFLVSFMPDASTLSGPKYNDGQKAVEMFMYWSQPGSLLKILQKADSVQAIFDEGDGFADVEGQFVRKKAKGKRNSIHL